MAKFVQPGRTINYKNEGSEIIKWGDVVILTEIIGIATTDIAVGAMGTVELSGVYEVEAETSAAFTVGQLIFWDKDNKRLTATKAESNAVIAGRAIEAKGSSSATALIKLGG